MHRLVLTYMNKYCIFRKECVVYFCMICMKGGESECGLRNGRKLEKLVALQCSVLQPSGKHLSSEQNSPRQCVYVRGQWGWHRSLAKLKKVNTSTEINDFRANFNV